ncbi:hypothetical protein HYH03_014899 [Edaphochlamys debaryana]|uniref:ubiquitinyl hydrolase 1 n=1 Tax=Edaphochlamys debaryana TaxID=47281 RepID=A0A835XKI1_9CHLO|nr:hypothetical protein HYH03_014899 [Edaphochlamys debaryana]|eukprot:KAG2486452.1 hypothetical protein HYH03_014899 [Edaphochlamys debaryana]
MMASEVCWTSSAASYARWLEHTSHTPDADEPPWPGLEAADLSALAAAQALAAGAQAVTWFPDYGAALLALEPGPGSIQPDPGTLALHLVCLDGWEFRAHSSPGAIHHTADSAGHQTLCCGRVPCGDLGGLVQRVHALVARSRERRAAGDRGYQRTPALVRAAVEAAVGAVQRGEAAAAAGDITSRGGFADVGQHTGGDVVRDTCWPLVQAVMQLLLSCAPGCAPANPPALLLRWALPHLELCLLWGELAGLGPDTALPEAVTCAVHMLECAARKAAGLADEGHDVGALEAACASARGRIEEALAQRALAQARALELPADDSPRLTGEAALPSGTLPPARCKGPAAEAGLEAARQRAANNLGAVDLLEPGGSFGAAQSLLAAPGHPLALCSLERELFRRAAAGFERPDNRLGEAEVADLVAAVDGYQLRLQQLLEGPAARAAAAEGGLLRAELHSRELLVVWVAYCLVHTAASWEYGIVLQYGVALSYKDLRHLVLSDREAVDAALAVAAYLRQRGQPGRELFSLREGGSKATFEMANAFAASEPRLRKVWEQAQADAAARRDKHWAEVQRRQEQAREVRAEMDRLRAEGAGLEAHLDQLRRVVGGGQYWADVEQAAQAVRHNQDWQRYQEKQLATVRQAPTAVIQPLPADPTPSRVWVFFLHMPPLFRSLARTSFLGQQMLLPRPLGAAVSSPVAVQGMATSLAVHYNSARADRRYLWPCSQTVAADTDGRVQLWSSLRPRQTRDVGPRDVEQFSGPSDGVWHPDGLTPCMAWRGSGGAADSQLALFGGFFNPFAPVPAVEVERFFTAVLPAGAEALQWALHTPEEPPADRGNWAIAWQDQRPSRLDKPAFLAFGSLRAFPLRQLWRLCVALRERTLPLGHPAVHVLVRQLLYHMGTLTDEQLPQPLWRTGWGEEPHGVLPTLCAELAALAEALDPAPREQEAVALLGPLAAYLASFHAPCCAVARRFAAMTARVADELEAQLDEHAADARLAAALQARQCAWRAMAVLSLDSGALDDEEVDAGALVRLAVLLQHGRVFLPPDPQLLARGEALQLRARGVLARRIDFLVRAAARRPHILTAAVGAVLWGRDLGGLRWAPLPGCAACWEAEGPGGRLVSLNLVDGTVLFDGWPPSRLPREMTQHPLYGRVFGSWSFEVAAGGGSGGGGAQAGATRSSTRCSLRPVEGRLYEFATWGHRKRTLLVAELDVGRGLRLELPDAGVEAGCGEWGGQLPQRLRELYSHWLCRELNVIVLRPHSFQEHDTHFLIQCTPAAGAGAGPGPGTSRVSLDCRRVPPHLRRRHWADLHSRHWGELTDRLVLLSGCALADTLLSKLDAPQFVHCYQPAPPEPGAQSLPWRLLFELPRFGFEFELRGGGNGSGGGAELASRAYPGYRLRRRQLLVDAGCEAGYGSDRVSYTLPEFRRYLVLECCPAAEGQQLPVGTRRGEELVLVPAGPVVCGTDGQVTVDTSPNSGARLEEQQQLRSVGRLGGHLAPGLRPLAAELQAAAAQLRHLYPAKQPPGAQPQPQPADQAGDCSNGSNSGAGSCSSSGAGLDDPVGPHDACLAYQQAVARARRSWAGLHPRHALTPSEELRALGAATQRLPEPEWRRRGHYQPVTDLPAFPVAEGYVAETEAWLASLVAPPPPPGGTAAPAGGPPPAYPLRALGGGVLTWLALCVLEDRLGRLVALAGAGEEYGVQLVQELQVRREWDVRAHPQWLVFEAEGRLQIRPQQYAVAAHLMDPANAGAIAQLNMGEGKTRVILPMLAMSWADGSRVVRLTFLSTLLDEAYGHLHAALTATLLGRRLLALPFHRDVELTAAGARAMTAALRHCQRDGGLVLVAPEHRLSLLLKRTEAGLRAAAAEEAEAEGGTGGEAERGRDVCAALDEQAALPYVDVLDESDELLHHRLQLVYACGGSTALPAVTSRVGAVQALLAALSRLASRGRLRLPEGAAVLEPPPPAPQHPPGAAPADCGLPAAGGPLPPAPPQPGCFCGLRLLPGAALSEGALRRLRRALAWELAERPPLQLHWLKEHPLRARTLACMRSARRPAHSQLGAPGEGGSEAGGGGGGGGAAALPLPPDRLAQVLALRGLLGCGLLEHCLQKRHRVDYGVDRSSARRPAAPSGPHGRTRMAVPYRAAHVPSERSEFAQPDVALLLTHLSYYYDGLSLDELKAALTKLLAMGPSARRDEYEERWLPLARDGIAKEHLPLLDSAAKLDPTNPTQLQLPHAHLAHNTAAVDFWLSRCVLPAETRQFPQRLATSAWHLAGSSGSGGGGGSGAGGGCAGGGGGVVGFSGTNDNHRLLPLQVHRASPGAPALAATNGRMLAVMLGHTRGFTTLPAEGDGRPAWQALLDTALALQGAGGEGLGALIDCGALLAGTSNRDAAAYLLPRLPGDCRGVTFFDEPQRSWLVADRTGRAAPLHASPIPEADTFVLFDDARCRGADLKLRLRAVGLLTLGPGTTKDRVMQAAGRLRQLGRGQALWLAAAPDVAAKVRSAAAAAAAVEPSLDACPAAAAAEAVLRWVMANTVEATLAGVQAWADQGLAFAASGGAPWPVGEVLGLGELYGGGKGLVPVAQAVGALAARHRAGQAAAGAGPSSGGVGDVAGLQRYAAKIVERSTVYGSGHVVPAGGRADEECERELEAEEEREQEVERQLPRATPRSETDWDLAALFALVESGGGGGGGKGLTARSLAAAAGVRCLPLPAAVPQAQLAPDCLRRIAWSGRVLLTENCLLPAAPPPLPLNEHLRPLDALLLLPGAGGGGEGGEGGAGAEALLLSEREADALLAALWGRRRPRSGAERPGSGSGSSSAGAGAAPVLLSLCYLRDAWPSGAVPRLAVSLGTGATLCGGRQGQGEGQPGPWGALCAGVLVGMALFNGATSYAAGAARREVRALMEGRREEAEALVGMRGRGAALPRSDLERAVEGAREEG